MNTLKRERIIKNLYDFQKLDSWEDSEHFMEAVESVRIHFGIMWVYLDDVIDSIRDRYTYSYPEMSTSQIIDQLTEDTQYRTIKKYSDTIELFKEETNSHMNPSEFRTLCLEYMDFSQLI